MGRIIRVKERTVDMAFDLNAIKKKLAALNGQREQRTNVSLWFPAVGEHKCRIVPWPASQLGDDGYPYIERFFNYIGDGKGFLSPKQYGREDPVEVLIKQLHSVGDKETAKKLYPKSYGYFAVIVRGEEDKGVQIWKLGKQLTARMLSLFVDDEHGDWSHPETGYDLKVTVTQVPGKKYADMAIDARKSGTPLHADKEQAQKWMDSVPVLEDLFGRMKLHKSTEEIKTMIDVWLDGPSDDKGTTKGKADSESELDKLANDLANVKKSEPKSVSGVDEVKKSEAVKPIDDEPEVDQPVVKKSKKALDDAFAELGID